MKAVRMIGRAIRRTIEWAVLFCLAGTLALAVVAIASDFVTIPGWTQQASLH